jgi:hypothetical protein
MFTTLFFVLLAGVPLHPTTKWPMWVCVLLALAIGGGLAIANWPAQRRFYATKLSQMSPGPPETSDS